VQSTPTRGVVTRLSRHELTRVAQILEWNIVPKAQEQRPSGAKFPSPS
jgi:hypothetical protein